MKKSLIFNLCLIVSVILVSGCASNKLSKKEINSNEDILEVVENNNQPITQSNISVTMEDIALFLEDKKEHYPFSDEFVEKYQQSSGGYISNAKKAGLVVDKQLHEPNQKWHFFESWLYPSIEDGSLSWDEDAKSRVYSKLQCPELLLWIYEACEVDPSKVKQAKDIAELGEVQGLSTASIAKNMRSIVSWEDLETTILAYKDSSLVKYSVSINSSDDFTITNLANEYMENRNVEFIINVTNNMKQIDSVKVNGKSISSSNLNTYKFTMPKENVVIVVTLKDKNPDDFKATNVSLNVSNLSLNLGGKEKKIVANVTPIDTLDLPVWSIVSGSEIVRISAENNECNVYPLKVGNAVVKVTYNNSVSAECNISVSESNNDYVLSYSVTSNVSKLSTNDDVFNVFVKNDEGEGIISSISNKNDFLYGKANGGSGDNKWSTSNVLKMGTTSNYGSLTFDLNTSVKGVIITGYVHNTSSSVRVGDSSSLDWNGSSDNKTTLINLKSMSVISKDNLSSNSASRIEINFEETNSVRIDTTTKVPFYITGIEFIVD